MKKQINVYKEKLIRTGFIMIYCCKEHVELALDIIVDEHETAPILEQIKDGENLSTTCEYCQVPASYIVGNECSSTK